MGLTFRWTGVEEIKKWLSEIGKEQDFECDYIGAVRVGNLCFDLVERECDPDEYILFADLYVGGIDTGYGYSKKGYPYDYDDEVGFACNKEQFKGTDFESFQKAVEKMLLEQIVKYDKHCSLYSLVEKANESIPEEW